MKVSVIVPTYNGAHKLPNILSALSRQSEQDFELLIVVDGSTDNTDEVLGTLDHPFRDSRIIRQDNGGRAKVRNIGASEAKGSLLIFFDDDMRPDPEAVRQHIDHHRAFPGSIITGGQIEELSPGMPDFLRFKAGLSRKWAQDLGEPAKPMPRDNPFLTAANFSIARSTFEALGGFDERLRDAEDYDLAVRATRAGIDVYANPGIGAWHDDKVTCAAYIRRLRQYTAAQQRLVELKPELYAAGTKYTAEPPKGLKRLFFLAFCSRPLILSIDKGIFSWLPRSIRYKLYDYVITANGTYFPKKIPINNDG
jgi:glycosyltransferase involved in cell wall biosynthesis